MVGVQMRHNGQICAAGPVVGQRPPSPAQVPQPRAEQRVGEDTNAAVVDRAGRVPPPGDVRHLSSFQFPRATMIPTGHGEEGAGPPCSKGEGSPPPFSTVGGASVRRLVGSTLAGCGGVRLAGHRAAMIPAVNPCSSTLSPTVTTITSATKSAAAVSPCACRSSMAISANRIEASPRGPIQPRNNTSRVPRPDRTRASATGTRRTSVSESTAYSRTFQEIPSATTSGDERTEHEPHRRGHQRADIVRQLQPLLGHLFSAHGAGGYARHERGDEPVPAQGHRGEVGEHRQDQDGEPFSGGVAPARPPREHEQACSGGSDHHAHRHPDGELDQRVDQRCLAPGRATACHGTGQEEQHQWGRQPVVEAAFDVDDPAQPARYALIHDHGRGQRGIGGGQCRREQRDNPDAQPRGAASSRWRTRRRRSRGNRGRASAAAAVQRSAATSR